MEERVVKPFTMWRHFKGARSFVITVAQHSETEEKLVIVYLNISQELLKKRTKSRNVNFDDAKRMQDGIEKELSKTTIPVIIVDVKEKEWERD